MDNEAKTKHLKNIIFKIEQKGANQRNIDEVAKIIQDELYNEENSEEPDQIYINNLKQTISKQLEPLVNSRKKPENRVNEMNEFISHFKQDIDYCIGLLRSRE